jgi:putative transcriptional regulator
LRIISQALSEKVKTRQREQATRVDERVRRGLSTYASRTTRAYPKYLLSGLLRCGVCGSNLVVSGPRQGYVCSSRVNGGLNACGNASRLPRIPLENRLVQSLHGVLAGPNAKQCVVRAARARQDCRYWRDQSTPRPMRGLTRKLSDVQQHNEIIAWTRKPARVTKVDAQSIKVLRAKAGLTQEKFAALIQVDLSTLRNWEQGRREPTGPAKALILAITNYPKHVLRALEVGANMRKAG